MDCHQHGQMLLVLPSAPNSAKQILEEDVTRQTQSQKNLLLLEALCIPHRKSRIRQKQNQESEAQNEGINQKIGKEQVHIHEHNSTRKRSRSVNISESDSESDESDTEKDKGKSDDILKQLGLQNLPPGGAIIPAEQF